ncbi:hypothetical protein CGLO_06650 [Colletotrichum gloeosporioides Cg-14]|uniref:Uncharacterized protein n=1 Tax=Colletotrichum gloeosporioides (strain Cg-14) TaxID=1237896 RepID=T0LPG1_COLGC|nr:hypothetical protein CGLO_06650 [Colletotrichum gloeosporioides Cg-14]
MEGTERGPGRLKALGICNVAFHFQGVIAQPSCQVLGAARPPSAVLVLVPVGCLCLCLMAQQGPYLLLRLRPRFASPRLVRIQCPGSGLPYPLDCTAVPYLPTVRPLRALGFIVLLSFLNVKDAWNSSSNWEPGLWINVIIDGMKACSIGPSVCSRLAVCIL